MDEKQRVIVSTDLPTGAGLQPSNQAMLEPNDSGNLLSHLLKKTTTKPKKKRNNVKCVLQVSSSEDELSCRLLVHTSQSSQNSRYFAMKEPALYA